MQLACKGVYPKINIDRNKKNLWLPKGCFYQKNNLLCVAKTRGYSSSASERDSGDGDSIVPKKREVNQFSTFIDSKVDSNAHFTEINNGIARKKATMNLYQNFFNTEYYKTAYESMKSKDASMTSGFNEEMLDGYSKDKINEIILSMKNRTFKFKPSKRIEIHKPNGKIRKIGIPSPVDKITQKILKRILEEIYEPIFLNTSHGFRPNKGTHTALKEIKNWTGITWAIEGDVKSFFDEIDHQKLAQLLSKEIYDKNIIDLYWKLVHAGYVNNGEKQIVHSISGVPQGGGVISPLLNNVYLHEFDKFMEDLKKKYTEKGVVSKMTRKYVDIHMKVYKTRKDLKILLNDDELSNQMRKEELRKIKTKLKEYMIIMRNTKSRDKVLTKIYYVRYADDWIVGVTGTKKTAQEIKDKIKTFLKDNLKIELNEEKTKITHMTRDKAYFLGTEIRTTDRKYSRSLRSKYKRNGKIFTRLPSTGKVKMYAPVKKLITKLKNKGFAKEVKVPEAPKHILNSKGCKKLKKVANGRTRIVPCANTKWIQLTEIQLLERYQSVLTGILNYYSFVDNYSRLHAVIYILKYSLICTLARKLRLNTAKVIKKYGKNITIPMGNNKTKTLSFPTSLKKGPENGFKITKFDPFATTKWKIRTISTLDRDCILCGAKNSEGIEMHHIKKLNNADPRTIKQQTIAMNRKQIPVCKKCHDKIHRGNYDGIALRKANTK